MPRGRPKGSKNKTSSRKGMAATPTQLASLAKARKVRAKQRTYFPALPEGGVKALSTPARLSALKSAYKKFSKKKMSGANKMMAAIGYGSIRTAYPVSYATGLSKVRKPRVSKPKTVSAAVKKVVSAAKKVKNATTTTQVVAAAQKVKKAATATQLAALTKARAARNANRGDYVALPKGGYRALTTVARKNAKAAAYAAMSNAMLSGNNQQVRRITDAVGRFVITR